MRQIFLDTETTGLNVRDGNRIVEIGCVEMQNRQLTGQYFHRYLNPGRDSEAGALAVHGLTSEFLADKPCFAEIVAEFLDFVRGAEIVIHNAQFDLGFINAELASLDLPELETVIGDCVDTIKIAREMNPGKKASLDALCERYGVDNSRRTLHGALLDAEILADVYLAMTRGQESLAMELSAPSVERQTACPAKRLSHPVRVLRATDREQAEHERVLATIDRESQGKCLWIRAALVTIK